MSLAALDVAYEGQAGHAVAWCFPSWEAMEGGYSVSSWTYGIPPYESGQFYKRELPCLLDLLKKMPPVDALLVDGHVDLDTGPGLGRHLYDALAPRVVVVGVAKRSFAGAPSVPVCRGASRVPLWVSAAGMDLEEAAARVKAMAGPHRIPHALKKADRGSKGLWD